MSYYLPALAQWRNGPVGKAVARVSEMAIAGYNILLNRVYTTYRVRVADVFGAFHTADFGQQVAVPGSAHCRATSPRSASGPGSARPRRAGRTCTPTRPATR
jgi:hypothetical protein